MDLTALYAQLKRQEGLRLNAYQDTVRVWTIGYGHAVGVKPGQTCTLAQAETFLENDVKAVLVQLDSHFPWWRDIECDARQNALVNMCYNIGYYRLTQFVNFLAHLKAGEYDAAANEMKNSLWAKQVPNRVSELAQMMKTGEFTSKPGAVISTIMRYNPIQTQEPGMFQEMFDSIVRHALTGAAGILVTHGYATNDQATQLVGGIMAAIAIFLSYRHKQGLLAKQAAASTPQPDQGN
jgi:lysozyme